jgi:hypothetical protein
MAEKPTEGPADEEAVPETDDCIICLEAITVRGQIDSCLHKFCFSCIIKWSKVTNTCPVCKRNFRQVTELNDSLTDSVKGKSKKKKKPKVVKIKAKPQTVDHPPHFPLPDLYATDIRALFMQLAEAMFWGSEDDSDYVEGENDEIEGFPWALEPRHIDLIDRFENGRHVIEILDDDDDNYEAEYGDDDDDDDDIVEILSAPPPPPPSRRGRRGESLFGRVGSSGYRAAPPTSSSSSSSSLSAAPTPVTRAATRSRTVPEVRQTVPRAPLRSAPCSLRGELNSVPSSLPRAVSEPKPTTASATGGRKRSRFREELIEDDAEEPAPLAEKRQRRAPSEPPRRSRRGAQMMSTLRDTDEEEEEVEDETQEEEEVPQERGRRVSSRRKVRR